MDAESGGVWSVTLKRLAAGTPLPLAAPCTLDLWATGADPATVAPVKTVAGVLAGDSKSVRFALDAAEVTALGIGEHEHRIKITDPTAGTLVLIRGWFTVRGRVMDP